MSNDDDYQDDDDDCHRNDDDDDSIYARAYTHTHRYTHTGTHTHGRLRHTPMSVRVRAHTPSSSLKTMWTCQEIRSRPTKKDIKAEDVDSNFCVACRAPLFLRSFLLHSWIFPTDISTAHHFSRLSAVSLAAFVSISRSSSSNNLCGWVVNETKSANLVTRCQHYF